MRIFRGPFCPLVVVILAATSLMVSSANAAGKLQSVAARSSKPSFVSNKSNDGSIRNRAVLQTRAGAVAVQRNVNKAAEMVTKKDITIPLPIAITAGLVLAFNSGYINGACLSGGFIQGTKQAVAAVTGAWTNSALLFADGKSAAFQKQAFIILSYLGGSAIYGFLDPRPTTFKLSESTGPTFIIGSLLLWLASHWANNGGPEMGAFYLAAAANGLQNSITSVLTGNLIRSAHYSGMTSDMGTFLGQVLRGNMTNLLRLKVNTGLCLAFWLGGFLGFGTSKVDAPGTLIFSAILYALIGVGLMALRLN